MKSQRILQSGLAFAVVATTVAAVWTLTAGSAIAKPPPRLDCGPTRGWICVFQGCPSCNAEFFVGTVCEKADFERSSGRTCSPSALP